MRNAAIMTVGVIAAIGAAFAVAPAFSDGPANYNSSAYTLGDDDHAEYVTRQTDSGSGRLAYEDSSSYENASPTDGLEIGDRQRVAQSQTTTTIVTTPAIAEESIEVQARRMPNGAPVAVRGMVTSISGKQMMLQRGHTTVHARLPGMIDEIRDGDDVTVYGRVANRGDDIAVRTEAVLLMTGVDEGRLFLSPSKLESVNKRNAPITRAAARNSLDYYRFNFTPL